jgi:hypothetical protein
LSFSLFVDVDVVVDGNGDVDGVARGSPTLTILDVWIGHVHVHAAVAVDELRQLWGPSPLVGRGRPGASDQSRGAPRRAGQYAHVGVRFG